jgi:hypothetical protein
MIPGVDFEHENPQTVYDILWSWSSGHLATKDALRRLEVEDVSELYQAAHDNNVPYPGRPSARDLDQANEFVAAVAGAA